MKNLALHWKILIGMVAGVLFAILLMNLSWGQELVNDGAPIKITEENISQFDAVDIITKDDGSQHTFKKIARGKKIVLDWIGPWGTMFINLLKLIAIPLIIASLIKGIGDLNEFSRFKKMGLRTIVTYILTTLIAIVIGLAVVNIVKPGKGLTEAQVTELASTFENDEGVQKKMKTAEDQKGSRPLDFVVNIVPDNIFKAVSANGNMLQVIFFVIFIGISLLLIDQKVAQPFKDFFNSLNEVILKMVDIIMLTAPYAVFALLAQVIVTSPDATILYLLLKYAACVVGGLLLMVVVYMTILRIFTDKKPLWFLKQISPAQLVAFSTSSSAATLPVTMERVEEHVGVDKEVSSFVLPIGATINMDGTSLYQAVAAVFICQVLAFDLTFADQLTIVFTALLASIGSAAVPGAGMVMLIIVLESINFPADKLAWGLALIFAVDRPLDMLRTTINVTGDATVATLVATSVGKVGKPLVKDWDDNLPLKKD